MKNLLLTVLTSNVALAATCCAGELKFETPMPFASAIEAYAKEYSDAERTINLARLLLSQPPLVRDSLISNDFHFTYTRLDREQRSDSGWNGSRWTANARGNGAGIVVVDQYGVVQMISADEKLFVPSPKTRRYEVVAESDEWVVSFADQAANPLIKKRESAKDVWENASKNGTFFRIDPGNWLNSFWVSSVQASDEPPVVECVTNSGSKLEIRFHNSIDLIRFRTPLRSVRIVALDKGTIRRLTYLAGPSVPRFETVSSELLEEWVVSGENDDEIGVSFVRSSERIHHSRINRAKPSVDSVWDTVQQIAATRKEEQIPETEELAVNLLHFMAASASHVVGFIKVSGFSIKDQSVIKESFVKNVGSLAKLARLSVVKEYGRIPVDEPAATLVYSSFCSPLTINLIERYACHLLERGDISEQERFSLLEGIANWGEPSFYDADCLLPTTLANHLHGGLLKARWGRILSGDEVAAMVFAASESGPAKLPAVESLIAAGHLEIIPDAAFDEWYSERVLGASKNDRAFAVHRLTNTEAGRLHYHRHAKSLSDDKDVSQLVDGILQIRKGAARIEGEVLRRSNIDTQGGDWKSLLRRLLR